MFTSIPMRGRQHFGELAALCAEMYSSYWADSTKITAVLAWKTLNSVIGYELRITLFVF
jgi:hypothetical protein